MKKYYLFLCIIFTVVGITHNARATAISFASGFFDFDSLSVSYDTNIKSFQWLSDPSEASVSFTNQAIGNETLVNWYGKSLYFAAESEGYGVISFSIDFWYDQSVYVDNEAERAVAWTDYDLRVYLGDDMRVGGDYFSLVWDIYSKHENKMDTGWVTLSADIGIPEIWNLTNRITFGIHNELHTVTPIPEPATMLLFVTGVACLVGSRIRSKKK